MKRLVLWDIDRTLLYVGDIDRSIYRTLFTELTGRDANFFPPKGAGRTQTLLIRDFFLLNGVSPEIVGELAAKAAALVAERLEAARDRIRREGILYPGAVASLAAVQAMPNTVATVLTGNLRDVALVKLRAFGLEGFVDVNVGGYSSDNSHRPSLVAVAQQRASTRYFAGFTRKNTVVIGDSLEDVVTGIEGGARVLAIASGIPTAQDLQDAGADIVLCDLADADAVTSSIAKLTG